MIEVQESGAKRKIKLTYIVTAVAISCLMLGASFAMILQGTSTPSIPTVIQPGSMVSGYSYIIFKDPTNTFVKNGTSGQISFSTPVSSSAMQYAINELGNRSGGSVYVAPAAYTMTATVNLASNTLFIGSGASTHLIWSDTNLYGIITGPGITGTLTKDIWVEGAGKNTGGNGCGVAFSQANQSKADGVLVTEFPNDGIISILSDNITVQNCIVKNNHEGIESRGSVGTKIINNIMNHIVEEGNELASYSGTPERNALVSGNTIDDVQEGAYYFGGVKDSTISNNIIIGASTFGIHGTGPSGETGFPKSILISGNTVKSCFNGIDMDATKYESTSILNNNLDTIAGYGIALAGTGTNTTIGNNQLTNIGAGGTGQGIRVLVGNKNVSITGNIISTVIQSGIYISNVQNILISSNTLLACPTAIYLTGGTGNCSINSNVIVGTSGDGILLASSWYNTVIGNRVQAGYGVDSTGTADYNFIIGNQFKGCTAYNYTLAGTNNIIYGNSAK